MLYFYVFLGGGFGALSRFGIGQMMQHYLGGNFPWGTLAANVLGALLIGFLVAYAEPKAPFTHWRALLVTGYLGGFTTFSSFSLETLELFLQGNTLNAALNILANLSLCLLMVYLGYSLGK